MTVKCPRCGTAYRRPARSGRGAEATYRCARCRHVFEVVPEEPAVVDDDDDAAVEDDRFAFDDEPDDAEEEPPAREQPERAQHTPAPRLNTPARFALRSLVGVSLGYAILSVYLYTHPEDARQLLRHIPLIGATLVETRLHPANIQLTKVRGEYQRVLGDQLVFVILGTAVNGSPVPVKGIQVEGRIKGAEEQRQVVFCGAARPDVQNLSLREIALLQTLEPPKEWTLGPSEETNFVVVFPGPPTDLREFSAEVVAVQGPTRSTEPRTALAR
jgi:predicted Zn finger-like uncharacterized protein